MEYFFKRGGQKGGDRNKPFKSSLYEPHKDISIEQIREWIYTVTILCNIGPQCRSRYPLRYPKPILGFQEIKTICITTLRYNLSFFFFTVLTVCFNSAKGGR